MLLGNVARLVGNEVWEQRIANIGDSQQLLSKLRLWGCIELLLQRGPASMGHWNRCRVARVSGSLVCQGDPGQASEPGHMEALASDAYAARV